VIIAGAAQTSRRRWVMLALGTTAQAVASCLVLGLPFLLPYRGGHERIRIDREPLPPCEALRVV
jgi:hypothetical protein